jgi:hypothetical protein
MSRDIFGCHNQKGWGCYRHLMGARGATKLLFVYYLEALEFELRALHLSGRHSTAPPALFAFSCFSDKVSCFCLRPALDCDPPTYASCIAGMRGAATTPGLFVEIGSC